MTSPSAEEAETSLEDRLLMLRIAVSFCVALAGGCVAWALLVEHGRDLTLLFQVPGVLLIVAMVWRGAYLNAAREATET